MFYGDQRVFLCALKDVIEAEDNLKAREVISRAETAILVEEYPDYPKGPSVLLLQRNDEGDPVHVVWGIPKGHDEPAVLVTAYKPDSNRWDKNFLKRRTL